ncbi:sigma factor [Brevibacillus invocatus]|uniref:sigma factor n=1 Tax=Brevibacillus invocatus TaxID=173959 RepID=UPI002042434D|nr:hypothetical protein [Brevibacillus invocatus]MCM3431282.1 hypothetical protein [Brevibacillus invocatus]
MNLEQLVLEAQKGDNHAFYQLMQMHKERLYRVAYAFLRNEQDALEAIQETTCRAYLKMSQLRQPAFFSAWLTRILIHCCIHEQKRQKRWVMEDKDHDLADNRVDRTNSWNKHCEMNSRDCRKPQFLLKSIVLSSRGYKKHSKFNRDENAFGAMELL